MLIVAGGLGIRWLGANRSVLHRASLPSGYIAERKLLSAEFTKYYGTTIEDGKLEGRFRQAIDAAAKGSLAGSTSVLETLVKPAALPVVYHNLGVGYALLGDYARAADAFREVLARDPEYSATRKFLGSFKAVPNGAAEPYTREQEPNNEPGIANLVGYRAPVGAEIAGANDAADYFKIVAPPSPRDRITIELSNHSINFAPRIRLFDGDLRVLSWGDKTAGPGESLTLSGGPPPNSVVYVSVSAADTNGGMYLLTVKPEKAFDRYEPNDDIASAKRISLAEAVSASIMDGGDSDFFSFQSPHRGLVVIEIQNQSNTLIPALTVYNGDRRNLGFAQEVRKPGANVRYTVDCDAYALYYIQISSQAGTAGAYSVRVE